MAGLHILIVEDSPIAQVVLKNHMINLGCKVDLALDGHSALEQSLSTTYDLILMDIGLGDGPDGFETASLIKSNSELNSTTPIMAVTAHGEPQYQEKATSVGMVGYFTKPFTPADAKTIIDFLQK